MTSDSELEAYRAKRRASATPEPFGGGDDLKSEGVFVVHLHDARRLHWDLRLELGGVLLSWAVPKGPSLDPSEKRFAVRVEDHPVEYADFEGVIPEGNYGAGPVILWDRGEWQAIEDPVAGLERGKLLFDLRGYKLRGRFTLVKTTSGDNHWLLIKKPDGFARAPRDAPFDDRSILSGLRAEELASGARRRFALDAFPKTRIEFRAPRLMLCETADRPFNDDGWIFELKYDGFRLAVVKRGNEARLFYRSGNDATSLFPEIVRAARALPIDSAILDGEVTVLDDSGVPSFQRLQQRAQLSRARDIQAARVHRPATYYAFDLLALDEHNVRAAPLVERRALLRDLLPGLGPLRYSDDVAARGNVLFAEVERRGLEGMVAKAASSPYAGGRSPNWLKIKADRVSDFVVVGDTPSRDGSSSLGALAVAAWAGEELRYAGRVGSGLSEADRRFYREALAEIRRSFSPCSPTPRAPRVRWCEPRLCVRVRYREWPEGGQLRHPVFLGASPRPADEACIPVSPPAPAAPTPEEGSSPPKARNVEITHPDKLFWPDDGYTKGDLIEWYRSVAPWLMEYLRDRPVVLTRYPDGITGKSFFQKDAPAWTPDWLRRTRIWSEHAEREIDYFVLDSVESLLYVVNSASIPLHVWASRLPQLGRPDWSLIDLDPKQAPFHWVVRIARELHRLCQTIALPAFVKTTGSTGLHVMLPLAGQLTFEQARDLAAVLGQVVTERLPEIATLERRLSRRGGRVYVDTGQNGHGRLVVAPFSVRALPGAPVSMPIAWSQVTKRLDPRRYTLKNGIQFLRTKGDRMRPLLDEKPDILGALERLHALLD